MQLIDQIFLGLFFLCILQRVAELFQSQRNQRRLRVEGFSQRESSSAYANMVALHSVWFISMFAEWSTPLVIISTPIRYSAAVIFLIAQIVRIWTLRTLGTHWNTMVMAPSAERAQAFVQHGPYRFIRHPNYLVVIVEIFSLPICGSSLCTAVIFSIWNAIVLKSRILIEEKFLFSRMGYAEIFSNKPRFIPRIIRRKSFTKAY